MSPRLRAWAKAHGFAFDRRTGAWVREDGCSLGFSDVAGWRVLTRGGGFHPTTQPPAPCGCGAERCDCDETPPLCALCDDFTTLEDGRPCPACCGDLYAVEACAECEAALATHDDRAGRPLCDACGGVLAQVPFGAMECPW